MKIRCDRCVSFPVNISNMEETKIISLMAAERTLKETGPKKFNYINKIFVIKVRPIWTHLVLFPQHNTYSNVQMSSSGYLQNILSSIEWESIWTLPQGTTFTLGLWQKPDTAIINEQKCTFIINIHLAKVDSILLSEKNYFGNNKNTLQ